MRRPPRPLRAAAAVAAILTALAHARGRLALAESAGGAPEPLPVRAISEAERAAVELVAHAAASGAGAVWDRLADGAPLRALGREAALPEIEARLGTLAGARLALDALAPGAGEGRALFTVRYASGIEDLLLLDFRRAAGGWALVELACGAEARRAAPAAAPEGTESARAAPAPSARAPAAAALALAGLALARRGRRRDARAPAAFALAALLAVALASCGAGERSGGSAAAAPPPGERLAPLLPLRRALTAGAERATIERELERAPGGEPTAGVRTLWEAQLRLAEGDLARAADLLAREPVPSPRPLAELLRARVALARLDLAGADAAFDRLAAAGVDADGHRYEALAARLVEGEVGLHDRWLARLEARAPRAAAFWYLAATAAIFDDRIERAERAFATGWRLEPLARAELLGDPALGALATRPSIFELVGFDSAEGSVGAISASERPIAVPPGVASRLAGAALELAAGGAELAVPNGAAIAPAGSLPESAEARVARARARALAELPRLAAVAASGRASAGDAALALAAAEALAEAGRWSDLARLAAGPFARPELLGGELARLRALALARTGRATAARDLLVELVGVDRGRGRPRVATLYDLGSVLGELGEYDQAIRLLRTADAQLPIPYAEGQIRRLALSRDLRARAEAIGSPHFSVVLARGTDPEMAGRMLELLERERRRLLDWIPGAGQERIEVELVGFRDFFATYGELGISGLYDGRIRVPFEERASLAPEQAAIAAHEIAHALLDEAAGGRAPRWFSEGLAQHVETWTRRANPLPDLEGAGRRISLTALEPILDGFAEAQFVELAYSQAAWAVGYLEARHGRGAIHRLIRSFAAGRDTEAAIREVLGLSMAELDERFWRWGVEEAPPLRFVEGDRYDLDLPPELSTN